MVPLVLSAPTSTDKVPALPRLSPTASRDVIGANLWNWKTSVTSPREEDIKPRPLQRHLSGSGGATAAMSLKHAWLILQPPLSRLSLPRACAERLLNGSRDSVRSGQRSSVDVGRSRRSRVGAAAVESGVFLVTGSSDGRIALRVIGVVLSFVRFFSEGCCRRLVLVDSDLSQWCPPFGTPREGFPRRPMHLL
ncbi:hypothetical protein HPB51_010785 [Rhipicephalus microplus]|uniref:Uncharacterized protein n=1 Tax=Rhipicephalus microplus TaxID=6941 RepID=A0A9J6DU10_RHIMP|nr:hypothetical protein HPB51_010785 [Rhipicephalus microplus]